MEPQVIETAPYILRSQLQLSKSELLSFRNSLELQYLPCFPQPPCWRQTHILTRCPLTVKCLDDELASQRLSERYHDPPSKRKIVRPSKGWRSYLGRTLSATPHSKPIHHADRSLTQRCRSIAHPANHHTVPATPSAGTISSAIATDGRGDMRCRKEGER